LQIALKSSSDVARGLASLPSNDADTSKAIRDFWDACVAQLSLSGEKDAIPAFVKIIESWRPRSDGLAP
ncbi:MAG: hypothetical protein JWO82_2273, partial [Akkermansiaceae bacterium]|nr:hypothetical protein [Akkermansiaceae bacterium]